MKRWNKKRINFLHFSYSNFYDYDNFVTELLQVLQMDVRYSLLLKIKYNKELYGMGGVQIGFLLKKDYDVNDFQFIHESLIERIRVFTEDYGVEEINSVQLLYVTIEDMPEFKITNFKDVNFKVFVNERESKFKFSLIPLTMNNNYFGKLILKDKELYLDRINRQRYILNQDKLVINNISSMYLYDEYVIINIENNDVLYRDVYNAKSGILITSLEDKVINDNLFIRKIGSNYLNISDDKIVKIESRKQLSPIKYRPKSLKDEPNSLIGSWDIEAFRDEDGYAKVYALGFYVLGGKPKTYYLEKGMSSEDLVLQCIDDMLVNELKGYTFYTHNFGRYDSTFLIKILKEFNIRQGYEHYELKTVCRDNKILKLSISVRRVLSDRKFKKPRVTTFPGYNTITIVDSLNLLNQSLDKLCQSFGVEVVKGNFPHKFVSKDTLYYVGELPAFSYWNSIKLSDFNKISNKNWNLKDECIKYLEKDLISLTLIINKFSEYINRKYHLQVTDSLTISRLALNIYLKEYLKDSKLPIIGKNMFLDIKKAYYGGVTEVYKPFGKNLFYYDVNSLYPFAALNTMPGIDCTFVENVNGSIDLNDLFGFFYCEIETNDNYLGLLPVHTKEGLIMPNGNWKGWYFSEELKYAYSQGYKINVIKGYSFSKIDGVFNDYVNDLYKIKSTTKDSVEKDINKRLLNHLLGRFGMNIVKPITELVDDAKLSLILSTREIFGQPRTITDNDYWVTYNPEVNQDICRQHGIDYFKVLNLNVNTDSEKLSEFNDVSLTTAAAVTSYARVYMSKIKLAILNKGGSVYYTDTDSIVTDITLDDKLVGSELGQFKLEHKIKKGYFISNKTYCLQLFNKVYNEYLDDYVDFIIKSKSVHGYSLTVDDFIKLYKGISIEAKKRFAISDYSKGSVLIMDDMVTLNHDSYTKREKITKRSKWIDTKPLILKNSVLQSKISKPKKPSKPTKLIKSTKLNKPFEKEINKSLEDSDVLKKDVLTSNNTKQKYFTNMFVYFKNIHKVFDKIMYYLECVIIFLTWLGMFILLAMVYTTNNEVVNNELESLLESRYSDDYMEEPVPIEIFEDTSYSSIFIDYLNNFKNLFIHNNLSCNVNTYCMYDTISPINVTELDIKPQETTLKYTSNYRPQVLVDVLRNHLDSTQQKLDELNNMISVSEISRVRRDNLVWEALTMCRKALDGQPYDSPILGHNSPILGRTSSLLERGTSFKGYSPSITQSPISDNKALINDITSLMNSPYLASDSSIIKDSPVINSTNIKLSSPIPRGIGIATESSSPIIPSRNPVGFTTPVVENQSFRSSPLRERGGLLIDDQNALVGTQYSSNIIKPPLLDVYSPNTLKRFGHVWSDNTFIEDCKPIKRHGSLWPSNTSILDDYNPYTKRYGRIWQDGVTDLKNISISSKGFTQDLE